MTLTMGRPMREVFGETVAELADDDPRIVMLDGDPGWPDLGWQWRVAEETRPTFMGVSPTFLMACRKAGLEPGTLMYVGDKKGGKPRITVIDYDAATFLEKEVATVEECFPFKETATVTWEGGIRLDPDILYQDLLTRDQR